MCDWEEKVALVKRHYEGKGYRVHSGLQFGSELVLYADRPDLVHSDFCIHVVRDDELIDWREMQSLVRSMPDLHKTLILANVRRRKIGEKVPTAADDDDGGANSNCDAYVIEEIAVATEHAPFRHRQKPGEVGSQKKTKNQTTTTNNNHKQSSKKQKTTSAAEDEKGN